MSSFRCLCGVAFRDGDASDASLVAYPLPVLNAIETRIAESVAAFQAAGGAPARAAWLANHFHAGYPAGEPDRGVIEDIVSRELNEGFVALFRCPSCDRLWLCDPITKEWASFRPERSRTDAFYEDADVKPGD